MVVEGMRMLAYVKASIIKVKEQQGIEGMACPFLILAIC